MFQPVLHPGSVRYRFTRPSASTDHTCVLLRMVARPGPTAGLATTSEVRMFGAIVSRNGRASSGMPDSDVNSLTRSTAVSVTKPDASNP
jgi:hypothetical protein